MSKRKQTLIGHWLYMMFSFKYRQEMAIEEGEDIWRDLNNGLEPPKGVLEDDNLRLRQFADRVKTTLSPKQKEKLVYWMRYQLSELEMNFSEHTSATIENHERKWKQIYRTHLEVIL